MVMIFAGFGDHDWIVDFSRPLTGNLYFVPTAEFLDDPPLLALSQRASIASGGARRVSSAVAPSIAAPPLPREDVKTCLAPEISFDADIKPLFREKDRDSMRSAFDLWSYADVQTHAAAIAERLKERLDAVRRCVAPRTGRVVRTLGRARQGGVGNRP